MENNKHIIVGGLVGLVALGVAFLSNPSIVVQPSEVKVVQNDAPSVGAASPDFNSRYFSYGGVRHWGTKSDFIAATNTPCAIQAPAATSTLRYAVAKLETSTTTASQLIWAKATTAFATTTALSGTQQVAANGQASIFASSTLADASIAGLTFAPNTWLVLNMVSNSTGVGTVSPTGHCSATWVEN